MRLMRRTIAAPICALVAACGLALPGSALSAQINSAALNRQFQSAVALYHEKEFDEAKRILSGLVERLPSDFQVNELMGLVCASERRPAEATQFFEKAVKLRPDSAEAHTALAGNLMTLGRAEAAGEQFRKAQSLSPDSYDTNHNLGEFYIRQRNIGGAVPWLQKAQSIQPSYANGYDLALAEIKTGNAATARQNIERLLQSHNTADLHSLLGTADEQTGRYLDAESELQLAAHMDPSEANIFAWGSELLVHHTLQPAAQVFQRGAALYPASARMQVGLGIALYSRTHYAEAINAFCRAIDLNPDDPRPYQFLGRVYDVSPLQASAVTNRFARYARLEPHNPQALYYYALSLWKASRNANGATSVPKIQALLEAAVAAKPLFASARVQLGILYAQEHRYKDAITEYSQALRENPGLADAHYHLGEALVRTGHAAEARREFATFSRLHESQVKDEEKLRSQILEFVYTADSSAGSSPGRSH